MTSSALSTILVFGAGRAGLSFAGALAHAGASVRVATRSALGAERVRARGLETGTPAEAAVLWLIAVPDDAIDGLASTLAVESRDVVLPAVALHASGSVGSSALAPLAARGVRTGTIHPMQTLTLSSPADALVGIPAAVGGGAAEDAAALARTLGMRPFTVPEETRALYHAANAMAANFSVALLESAIALATRAGVPPDLAREGLAGLAGAAAGRVAREGTTDALTGPIRRGDVGTVRRHLAAIDHVDPSLGVLYRALGDRTLALAVQGGLASEPAMAMHALLVSEES